MIQSTTHSIRSDSPLPEQPKKSYTTKAKITAVAVGALLLGAAGVAINYLSHSVHPIGSHNLYSNMCPIPQASTVAHPTNPIVVQNVLDALESRFKEFNDSAALIVDVDDQARVQKLIYSEIDNMSFEPTFDHVAIANTT